MMQTYSRLWYILVLGLAGCGGNDIGAVLVRGSVTLDGVPVAKANITFIRDSGGGPAAYAVTDETGTFDLRTASVSGAVPGKYKVVVQKDNSADLAIPQTANPQEFMEQNKVKLRSLLPVHYSQVATTPLRYEIFSDPAKNRFEIKLTAAKPQKAGSKN